MGIETITRKGDSTQVILLTFGREKYTKENIIACAGEARSDLNKALVIKAVETELLTLLELKWRYRWYSAKLLKEWAEDLDVRAYLSKKGPTIPTNRSMMSPEHRAKLYRSHRSTFGQESHSW